MFEETMDVVLIGCWALFCLSQVCSVGLRESAFDVKGSRSFLSLYFVLGRSWGNAALKDQYGAMSLNFLKFNRKVCLISFLLLDQLIT